MKIFFALIALLLLAAPAFAQKDTMNLGEKLGATVVRKSQSRDLIPPIKVKANPARSDSLKTREALEVESKTKGDKK